MKLTRLAIVIICTLLALGIIWPANSEIQFVLFQMTSVVLSLHLVRVLILNRKTYISLLLPLITNANGAVMISIYTLLSPTDNVYNNTFTIRYLEHAYAINIAYLIPPVVIYLVSRFVRPRPRSGGILQDNSILSEKQYLISLAVVSFFFLSFFSDVLFEIPFLGYISRVGKEAFLLFTFWLGYWNFRLKGVFYLGLSVIGVTTFFSVLSGGRFYAFMQLGALFIGYVVNQPLQRRKTLIKLAVVLLPIAFSVSGVLSYVRNQIGRGDVSIVNIERFSDFIDTFGEVIFSGGYSDDRRNLSLEGMRRNIKWPNLSVIALSPQKVPYRGFENMDLEISSIFQIAAISSGFDVESVRNAREENIEKGLNTGMANRYGYNVNRMNSVEWGLFADAWSRGGPLVYVLYLGFILSMFVYLERKILTSKLHHAEKALLIVVLLRILWLNTGSDPLYYILRSLMLSFSMAFSLILAIRFLTVRKYQKYHHSRELSNPRNS